MRHFPVRMLVLTVLPFLPFTGYGRIPDEYESNGGHSLAFGGGGVAAVSGQSSVKNNPAMLALEKQYTVSGTYNWPSYGRKFYQVGAVDSKTSAIATGLTYTSSQEKFSNYQEARDQDDRLQAFYDSPVKYRLDLGFGVSFSKLAAGLGVEYVEGFDKASLTPKLIKGPSFGLGLAGLITQNLRFGISAENLANEKVMNLSPRRYRAGFAYTLFNVDVTAHIDYSQRERIAGELAGEEAATDNSIYSISPDQGIKNQEKMVTLSGSARVQDLVRLLASYGYELGSTKRQSVGGGIALVNQNISLSYLVHQPYQTGKSLHQGINLSLTMAL